MRFEDSPNLFGASGVGTYANVSCDWCGKIYEGREEDIGDGDIRYSDESISLTNFGRKQICDCCFEEIENAVLARIDDIIPWFIRILKEKHKNLDDYDLLVDNLVKALKDNKIGVE